MSRWKELPAELDPRVHQLVVRLRRLKDHAGLSTRQLAAKTGYSAKSWERYLNGRSLPPREAVEATARVTGDDPARLLALHEVAAERWAPPRGAVPPAESETAVAEPPAPTGEQARRRPTRVAVVAGAVTLVLAVAASVLLAVRLTGGSGDHAHGHGPAPAATAAQATAGGSRSPVTYTCRVKRVDGRWYAGNSRTREAIVAYGHAGPEVAEAQCLLRRAGISPGEVDGIYGPLTQRAVKRVQKRDGLVVDGIIGPHTWKALRGKAPT
ncbi:peptidoglycan-binding protein [Streptomyces lancefieldiae]|uniref:Peptidoglycan-binding protein n=1 Tax=Streptomyces lancefieldiae TaxID=3075520 RepID=A0ABU3AZ61_9ACTN|nr:peptidoglycan-binding protein [Streptomyces sp. DSM 40712]MDT0615299.1 peptidoglycan-binding protein [Streptomyces sp. DSM 40712]